MKDSKINKNKEPFSDKEIKADENFEKLLKQNATAKFRKDLKAIGLLVGSVLLITGLVVYFSDMKIVMQDTEQIEGEGRAIQPQLFDIPTMQHVVNAEDGAELVFNNSTITIPSSAFTDEEGNAVIGEVEISYREFHNPVDFFLSGIPMVYDSADYQYHFESAGMFEIYGFQNGKPLNLVKPITVKLASLHQGDYFNIYRLDTLSGEWTFISKDTSKVKDISLEDEKELANINNQIAKIIKEKPVGKAKGAIHIKLDFDKNEFPELATLKGVLFELDENDRNFSPDLAKKDWDDIKLKKVANDYVLTFYDGFKPTKLKATPVLSKRRFKKALKEYNKKYGEKLNAFRAKRDSLEFELRFNSVVFPSFGNSTERYVERLFEINSFGVWNSDCPMRMPKGKMLAAIYINKIEGTDKIDTLDFKTVYLVEENKNTLYRITNNGTLTYNPQKKYVLWAIDKKEQLCVFPAAKFKAIPSQVDSTFALEMNVSKVKPSNVDEVRKELDLNMLFKDV